VRNAINSIQATTASSENILALALNVPAAVASAMQALEALGDLLSAGCFANPATLTHDSITAYALALMRVRECAIDAGLARLADACDALAVTVSRLIDDDTCASQDKCEALTRFVVHAQAMIEHATWSFVRPWDAAMPGVSADADAYARYMTDSLYQIAPGTSANPAKLAT
jgi:hypothetical protein